MTVVPELVKRPLVAPREFLLEKERLGPGLRKKSRHFISRADSLEW